MSVVSPDLLEIAQRIAGAENRISTLAARVERLKEEGSDPGQALEFLRAARHELNQLYRSQVWMRGQSWVSKSAARLRRDAQVLGS